MTINQKILDFERQVDSDPMVAVADIDDWHGDEFQLFVRVHKLDRHSTNRLKSIIRKAAEANGVSVNLCMYDSPERIQHGFHKGEYLATHWMFSGRVDYS